MSDELKHDTAFIDQANAPSAATIPPPSAGEGPSPNGSFSDARRPNGQFAKGNRGGPGNPYARRVAELRKEMLSEVTGADLRAIIRALIEKAKQGCARQGARLHHGQADGAGQSRPRRRR